MVLVVGVMWYMCEWVCVCGCDMCGVVLVVSLGVIVVWCMCVGCDV